MSTPYRIEQDETLTIDTVTALGRAVATDHDPRLRVVGVTSTNGESGRVELIVTIHGCHADPCIVMLNVTRSSRDAFERELRDKFRDALASHVTEAA